MASFCVVIYHYTMNRAYHVMDLAFVNVDLFFCLSGFVLMHAYARRLACGMSVKQFMLQRIIRLYPMYILGSVIGFTAFLDGGSLTGYQKPHIGVLLISAVLMFPYFGNDEVGLSDSRPPGQTTFPFNEPAWSLFAELSMNVVFSACIWTKARALFIVCATAPMLVIASAYFHGLGGGWDQTSFPLGLIRISYEFTCGILIYLCHKTAVIKYVQVNPIITLTSIFAMSSIPIGKGVIAVPMALFVVPFIVSSALTEPTQWLMISTCRYVGRLSYPLYAIHYPVLMLARQNEHFTHSAQPASTACLLVFSVALSALVLRFYDEPLRLRLGRRIRR